MKTFISKSVEDTIRFAQEYTRAHLSGGDTLLLSGDLGAGKTVFTKGVALALGIKSPIKSPTFTLCCMYQGESLTLWHIDAYRLNSGQEGEAAGLAEYFGDKSGMTVIEWAEQIKSILPTNSKKVSIKTIDETTKEISYDE